KVAILIAQWLTVGACDRHAIRHLREVDGSVGAYPGRVRGRGGFATSCMCGEAQSNGGNNRDRCDHQTFVHDIECERTTHVCPRTTPRQPSPVAVDGPRLAFGERPPPIIVGLPSGNRAARRFPNLGVPGRAPSSGISGCPTAAASRRSNAL